MVSLRFVFSGCLLLLAPLARASDFIEDCGLEKETLKVPPVPPRRFETPVAPGEPPRVRRETFLPKTSGLPLPRLGEGALKGKTVYLSAGHGFTWTDSADAWRTQRGNTHDLVEDLVSIETVNQVLLPMLLNAGAHVVPVRESDLNPNMVIVDELDEGFTETGPANLFSTSAISGFGAPVFPMSGTVLPFDLGKNRLMNTSPDVTASARWTPNVPADGVYHVYVSYSSFSARATDAHYVVHHAGGDAHFRVNQRRHGQTWVLLGQFAFQKGSHPDKGSVELLNDSQVGGNVSIDAVRLGGGQGNIFRGSRNEVSRRPRFEESCRTYAQFAGAPSTVYQASSSDRTTDISCRSRFAAWDHEEGEDAVYVAWHTNAVNGSVSGTETYVYSSESNYAFDYKPCLPNTTVCASPPCAYGCGAPNSDLLARALHEELVGDIRQGLNLPAWKDRGVRSANFGELNPAYNPEMPAALIEVAYHDNESDASFLKEPSFRYVAARAFVQGLIRFFSTRDGTSPIFPPEPPLAVVAQVEGGNRATLRWEPPAVDTVGGHAAVAYRVYQSADGRVFDEGVAVATPSFETALTEGEVRYFKVSATNGGGESFPSPLVGVRAGPTSRPLLVVNGFSRLDAALGQKENLSAWAVGSPLRIFLEKMNNATYLRRHAEAIAWAGVPFDSATAAAVEKGLLLPSEYPLVDWFSGRNQALPASSQQALRAHIEGGRHFLLSGAHVIGALAGGSPEEQSFLTQILRADFASRDGKKEVEADTTQLWAGVAPWTLDDGNLGAYDTGVPDVLALSGGVALARYQGTSSIAATGHEGASKVVVLGFPFETVTDPATRFLLMGKMLKHFGVIGAEPPPFDGGVDGPPVTLGQSFESYPAFTGCGCGSARGVEAFVALLLTGLWRRRRR